jgi:mRNA-degrading endonuclease RelE of RelBE toxin-antitoxin system
MAPGSKIVDNIPKIDIFIMAWKVLLTVKARKRLKRLPKGVDETLQLLLAEMRLCGPLRADWPSYGKLQEDCHHCHLQKGRPTYVAVWRVINKKDKVIEVTYVVSHEKARYGRLC